MSFYLRLSVTEGCNLHCGYCRGPRARASHREALDDESLLGLVRSLHRVAPLHKLRITGGEPLCRAELPSLVGGLATLLEDAPIAVTTNGTLLANRAAALVDAGVTLLNVSLDSCDADRFAALTGGQLAEVHRGLAGLVALRPRLERVKLNAVLMRSVNGDAEALAALVGLAERYPIDEVRFIELMPIGVARPAFGVEHFTGAEALTLLDQRLERLGELPRQGTAQRYRYRLSSGGEIVVGLITPVSEPFCGGCDRLRLDSAGRLHDCLRREGGEDLAAPAARGDWAEVETRILRVVGSKRAAAESCWPGRAMVAIGG